MYHLHVVFFVPPVLLVLQAKASPHGERACLGIRAQLIYLVLGMGYVCKVARVAVEKPVLLLDSSLQGKWRRYLLGQLPVVLRGYR